MASIADDLNTVAFAIQSHLRFGQVCCGGRWSAYRSSFVRIPNLVFDTCDYEARAAARRESTREFPLDQYHRPNTMTTKYAGTVEIENVRYRWHFTRVVRATIDEGVAGHSVYVFVDDAVPA